MKIAIAQIECLLGDIAVNISQFASLSHKAANKGYHVIIFLEMVDTEYKMSVIREKTSSIDEAPF